MGKKKKLPEKNRSAVPILGHGASFFFFSKIQILSKECEKLVNNFQKQLANNSYFFSLNEKKFF